MKTASVNRIPSAYRRGLSVFVWSNIGKTQHLPPSICGTSLPFPVRLHGRLVSTIACNHSSPDPFHIFHSPPFISCSKKVSFNWKAVKRGEFRARTVNDKAAGYGCADCQKTARRLASKLEGLKACRRLRKKLRWLPVATPFSKLAWPGFSIPGTHTNLQH